MNVNPTNRPGTIEIGTDIVNSIIASNVRLPTTTGTAGRRPNAGEYWDADIHGFTTNTIEELHRQVRKAIKTRGHFPDEQAATKLIWLAIMRADAKWQRNRTWTAPRAALKMHFGDRFPG